MTDRHTSPAIRIAALLVVTLWFAATGQAIAAPPQVVKAEPDNGDQDVDPALKLIRIEFNQDMNRGGFSVCGGKGLEFPAKPRWKNARTFELPVKLEPEQTYQISINCPSAQNFKSTSGQPAESYPITFTTGKVGTSPATKPTVAALRQATERLQQAVDDHYSYRDLRGVDWNARFAEFAPEMAKADSWANFTRLAAKLMSAAEDPHVWFTLRGHTLGTFQRQVTPNYDPASLKNLVPNWKLHNRMVATGRFDDGIGYVLIANWSGNKADLAPALATLAEFADGPGIVLDVRANGGGNEMLAREVAGCFVREPVVYARNSNRDPESPGGFSRVYDRQLEPAQPAISAPVAVLMGPVNMSSCESFLMMMDQAPKATLVGARSYGSSGNPKPYELAPDLLVYLPSWKDLRLDGTPSEGQGVEPDVAVEATAAELQTGDPVLARALEILRSGEHSK